MTYEEYYEYLKSRTISGGELQKIHHYIVGDPRRIEDDYVLGTWLEHCYAHVLQYEDEPVDEHSKSMQFIMVQNLSYGNKYAVGNRSLSGRHHQEETITKIKDALKGNTHWLGKHHDEESIKKMRESHKGKGGCHGQMWITDGHESKRVPCSTDIPFGWRKGRVMNK